MTSGSDRARAQAEADKAQFSGILEFSVWATVVVMVTRGIWSGLKKFAQNKHIVAKKCKKLCNKKTKLTPDTDEDDEDNENNEDDGKKEGEESQGSGDVNSATGAQPAHKLNGDRDGDHSKSEDSASGPHKDDELDSTSAEFSALSDDGDAGGGEGKESKGWDGDENEIHVDNPLMPAEGKAKVDAMTETRLTEARNSSELELAV